MSWYLEVLNKYAQFTGRARRMEYWMFFLINMLISFAIGIVGGLLGMGSAVTVLTVVYSIAILIPSIAVGIRRLHDTGRSGWWMLIAFIPLLGAILLLVYFAQDSEPGMNAYGPNPKTDVP